jgi:glycosyltransferase involved in cell wall biosynthesis
MNPEQPSDSRSPRRIATEEHRGESNQSVVIITGMHRSATSLTAMLLRSAGIDIGQRLMPASAANADGYFEDLDFVDFHAKALRANGYADNGILASGRVTVSEQLRHEAVAIADARAKANHPWGWKDPRTVLFLDFWNTLLPDASHVFVFRSPWEVVDSLFRRGTDESICSNPRLAIDCWMHYNSLIRDFAVRRRTTCVVVESSDVLARPRMVIAAIQERLGVPLSEPESCVREGMFSSLTESPRETFIRDVAPEAVSLYEELQTLAERGIVRKKAKPRRKSRPGTATLEMGMADWSSIYDKSRQIAHLQNASRAAHATSASLQQQIETIRQEAIASAEALGEARLHIAAMESARAATDVAHDVLEARIATLQSELAACAAKRESQTLSLQTLEADHARLIEHTGILQRQIVTHEALLDERARAVAVLEGERAAREAMSADLVGIVAERQAAVDALQSRVAAMESDLRTARTLAESLSAGELQAEILGNPSKRNTHCLALDSVSDRDQGRLDRTTTAAAVRNGKDGAHRNGHAHGPTIMGDVMSVLQSPRGQSEWREHQGVIRPLSGLKSVTVSDTMSKWEMTDNDPHFDLTFPELSEAFSGFYEFRIDMPADSWTAASFWRARLYIDYGRGFREEDSAPLAFRPSSRGVACEILLRQTARRFRFDPSSRSGPLTLGRVVLKRISRTRYYNGALQRLIRRKASTPTAAITALRRASTVLRNGGIAGLAAAVRQADLCERAGGTTYSEWVALYDTVSAKDRRRMQALARAFPTQPLISIVMPTFNTPPAMLRTAIQSVLDQTYDNWELCIADDNSTKPHVRAILDRFAAADVRIKVAHRKVNGHIAAASNTALDLATGDWIAFLDHDDMLAPHALFCMVDAIHKNPQKHLFYSDEDKIDADNIRHDPYFKSDWNPDLMRSQNLVTHLAVYRASLLRELGGLRAGFDGAQDYDLVLRFTERLSAGQIHHIPHVLYHWRVHGGSTAASDGAKPYAMLAGERALNEHLARCGVRGTARLIGFGYEVDYELPESPPFVSIIIPTRNAHLLVTKCIDSILSKTTYRNYEILLVDNGSDEAAAIECFASMAGNARVRVIRDDRPFNYSALNNAAVAQARGDVVVLLNNDIEVISADWLSRLVSTVIQPGVGAVGAKLLYPDDTIQHGGVILGLGGLAAHAHTGFHRSSPGYVGRAALQQSVSAVTGACLAVRKDVYVATGGLDEQNLTVAYNDVDFCLKLLARGLRNVWAPSVELYHHESATRGYETTPEKLRRFEAEKTTMKSRWPAIINADPAYNPNLTESQADFSLAWPPRQSRPWV